MLKHNFGSMQKLVKSVEFEPGYQLGNWAIYPN